MRSESAGCLSLNLAVGLTTKNAKIAKQDSYCQDREIDDTEQREERGEKMLGKVSFSALFASRRLNGPLERNRRLRKNFAPCGLRISGSAGLRSLRLTQRPNAGSTVIPGPPQNRTTARPLPGGFPDGSHPSLGVAPKLPESRQDNLVTSSARSFIQGGDDCDPKSILHYPRSANAGGRAKKQCLIISLSLTGRTCARLRGVSP